MLGMTSEKRCILHSMCRFAAVCSSTCVDLVVCTSICTTTSAIDSARQHEAANANGQNDIGYRRPKPYPWSFLPFKSNPFRPVVRIASPPCSKPSRMTRQRHRREMRCLTWFHFHKKLPHRRLLPRRELGSITQRKYNWV